jgi:hypothetical protein
MENRLEDRGCVGPEALAIELASLFELGDARLAPISHNLAG